MISQSETHFVWRFEAYLPQEARSNDDAYLDFEVVDSLGRPFCNSYHHFYVDNYLPFFHLYYSYHFIIQPGRTNAVTEQIHVKPPLITKHYKITMLMESNDIVAMIRAELHRESGGNN